MTAASSSQRGIFVAVEGIDGSGTTTFTNLLAGALQSAGIPAQRTAEPSTGPVGRLLREFLRAQDTPDMALYALLFAADRRHHWLSEIKPALDAGTWVISDRYVLSSLAYQGIGEDAAWVASLNARAPMPVLTFLLDLPVETAQARIHGRGAPRENLEHLDFQEKVADRYRSLAQSFSSSLVVLDATLPPAHLVRLAMAEISARGLF